jgi:hypothetical protein
MHRSEVEALENNAIWREIVDTLKEVKTGLFEDLANLDPMSEAVEIARKQGRLYMIGFVLAQPDAILQEIVETANNEERKEGAV